MVKNSMVKISVVIITHNEEKKITRCIDSVIPVADEILVVDSFSSDRTQQICTEKGVRLIENKFNGHVQQKNFALAQATFDRVLSLDADEYLSVELTRSIQKIKASWPAEAYEMNRLSSYAGRWMKLSAWYPDRKLRLWNRTLGQWGGGNPHDQVVLKKPLKVIHLHGDLLHEAYDSVFEFLTKLQSYSTIFANERRYVVKSSYFKILYKTIYSFIFNFFIKLGLFAGFEGMMISITNTNHTFYKYAKLREANRLLSISLIVTTYNRKEALELVLMSILHQSCLPNEVIIADDGSDHTTRDLIEHYQSLFPIPLIHCWHEDNGFRVSAIRNKAIAQSKYEYTIVIDGDIVLHKNFVEDHKKNAWKGQIVQGSRVLLFKEKTAEVLRQKKISVNPFTRNIENNLNAIRSPFLSRFFSYFRSDHKNVRAANLSFWKEDFLSINGFNEDFIGWGREDSELAVRMNNLGIRRKHVKFVAFGYHLYHEKNSRQHLASNDSILYRSIKENAVRCVNGVDKYLVS